MAILIFNSLSLCSSIFILIHFKYHKIRYKIILLLALFTVDMTISLLLPQYIRFLPLLLLAISIFYIRLETKDILISMLQGLIIFSFILLQVLFFWSVKVLVGMKIDKNNLSYNFGYMLLLLVSSLLIRKFHNNIVVKFIPKTRKSKIVVTFISMVYYIFVSAVMPRLALDKQGYALLIVLHIILIVGIFGGAYYIARLERQNIRFEIENKFLQRERENNEKLIKLKHFYLRLYESCITYVIDNNAQAFLESFERYIKPIHEAMVLSKNHLEAVQWIHDGLLQNFFKNLILEISCYLEIDFLFHIQYPVTALQMDTADLIIILSVFFENALEEVRNEKEAYIHININRRDSYFLFWIKNSCKSKNKISSGVGLKIVTEILSKYSSADLETRKSKNQFIQILKIKVEE